MISIDPVYVRVQASKDWEPVQHLMHDYKGLVASWQAIMGLYTNMTDKHYVSHKSEKYLFLI